MSYLLDNITHILIWQATQQYQVSLQIQGIFFILIADLSIVTNSRALWTSRNMFSFMKIVPETVSISEMSKQECILTCTIGTTIKFLAEPSQF